VQTNISPVKWSVYRRARLTAGFIICVVTLFPSTRIIQGQVAEWRFMSSGMLHRVAE